MRTKTATFATPVVIAREPHYGILADGREYLVHMFDRLPAHSEIVQKCPMYFVSDGEPVTPFEHPEVEPEPEPKRKAVKRYRVTKARIVQVGVPGSKEAMVLQVGDVFPEKSEPWMLLTAAQRKEILEEVK